MKKKMQLTAERRARPDLKLLSAEIEKETVDVFGELRRCRSALAIIHETLRSHLVDKGLTPLEMFCYGIAKRGLK